jgi:glutamate racemase
MVRMMRTDIARVVIIDSGVGALSILSEIDKLPLSLEIDLILDNAGFPYGEKRDDWIVERALRMVQQYSAANLPDAVVVACNTLSTICLPALRERFDTPVVGVVPAIKTAAHLSRTKHIALLATPATVGREYSTKLIQDFAADCVVVRHGSVDLVKAAEQKIWTKKVDPAVIARETDFVERDPLIDVVVLGCTHFPFLKPEFEQAHNRAERKVAWIDSSEAIARRLGAVLEDAGLERSEKKPNKKRLFFSAPVADEKGYKQKLAFAGIAEILALPI